MIKHTRGESRTCGLCPSNPPMSKELEQEIVRAYAKDPRPLSIGVRYNIKQTKLQQLLKRYGYRTKVWEE